jgi:hypothetical protein
LCYVFVSNFYATREALGTTYKQPSIEYFCDAMILEKDNPLQLGMISTIGTSNKVLKAQHKYKSNNPKKLQRHHNNKKKKGPKSSLPTFSLNGDNKHCNFCGKYGHVESKFFQKYGILRRDNK